MVVRVVHCSDFPLSVVTDHCHAYFIRQLMNERNESKTIA